MESEGLATLEREGVPEELRALERSMMVRYHGQYREIESKWPSGPINEKYGPWTYQVDLKANKGFEFGRANVDFYVWVTNLFDRDNAGYVYQSTGSPESTGWLVTPEGEKWVADNGAQGLEWYNLAQQNPNNFGTPLMVRFGIRTDF